MFVWNLQLSAIIFVVAPLHVHVSCVCVCVCVCVWLVFVCMCKSKSESILMLQKSTDIFYYKSKTHIKFCDNVFVVVIEMFLVSLRESLQKARSDSWTLKS